MTSRPHSGVAFAGMERDGRGVDITSQMLFEVRAHWIMTHSALDVVTVNHGGRRVDVRAFLSVPINRGDRDAHTQMERAVTIYRVATALSYAPLKLVPTSLQICQSTSTCIINRAREGPRTGGAHTGAAAGAGRRPVPA